MFKEFTQAVKLSNNDGSKPLRDLSRTARGPSSASSQIFRRNSRWILGKHVFLYNFDHSSSKFWPQWKVRSTISWFGGCDMISLSSRLFNQSQLWIERRKHWEAQTASYTWCSNSCQAYGWWFDEHILSRVNILLQPICDFRFDTIDGRHIVHFVVHGCKFVILPAFIVLKSQYLLNIHIWVISIIEAFHDVVMCRWSMQKSLQYWEISLWLRKLLLVNQETSRSRIIYRYSCHVNSAM